jgi:cytochrome c oxidase assembly protein subunit 17
MSSTNTTTTKQPADFRGKSGKKICCACPDTKKIRDECVVVNGEEHCKDIIEKHKQCLRDDGFNV